MPATTLGALVGGMLGAYGRKPVVPELPTLDTGQEQRAAIMQNRLALPNLEKLAGETNQFSYDQISKMLEAAIPGLGAGLKSAGANATSLARGEVPEDVLRQWRSQSAASALKGGYAGSGFAQTSDAAKRLFGTLSLTGEGQNRLLGLGGFARNTFPTFDFTQAFISPQQKLSFDWQQNLAQWQVQALKNQVAAAPDPADAALAEGLDNMFHTFANVGLSYFGQSVATNNSGNSSVPRQQMPSGGTPGGGSWWDYGNARAGAPYIGTAIGGAFG